MHRQSAKNVKERKMQTHTHTHINHAWTIIQTNSLALLYYHKHEDPLWLYSLLQAWSFLDLVSASISYNQIMTKLISFFAAEPSLSLKRANEKNFNCHVSTKTCWKGEKKKLNFTTAQCLSYQPVHSLSSSGDFPPKNNSRLRRLCHCVPKQQILMLKWQKPSSSHSNYGWNKGGNQITSIYCVATKSA